MSDSDMVTIPRRQRGNEIKAENVKKIRKRNAENTNLIKMIITRYNLSTIKYGNWGIAFKAAVLVMQCFLEL